MTAITLIHVVTNLAFILLAGLTLIDFLSNSGWFHADLALVFADLALVAAVQLIPAGWNTAWVGVFTGMLLAAHPYLLLRMVRHFRPVSIGVQWFAAGGMLLSWLAVVIFVGAVPPEIGLAIVIYFLVVEGYNAMAFFQDTRRYGGITRRRLKLAAAGTSMIAGVLLVSGINLVLPKNLSTTSLISQGLGTFSVVCYFLGFAPPRWLRRAWQQSELHKFLHRSTGLRSRDQRQNYLRELCMTAMETVGGVGAQLALWSPEHADLVVQQSVFSPTFTRQDPRIPIDLQPYWQANRPAVLRLQPDSPVSGSIISSFTGLQTALVIPVANLEKNWGVLLVYLLRTPVYVQDDLDMLAVYTEQAAISLTYEALLTEQQALISVLNNSQAQLQVLNEKLKQEILEGQRAEVERERAIRAQAAREEAEVARRRFAFLASASQVLSSSLDEAEILARFAALVVPEIADGCEIELLERGLAPKASEFADVQPERAARQRRWRELHPVDPDSPGLLAEVSRTGQPKLLEIPRDIFIGVEAASREDVQLTQDLNYISAMMVPLRAHDRLMGVALFTTSSSGRRYSADDVPFLQDLANRAGLAIDNAILYAAAQREIAERVHAEQALRESQDALLLTTEAADVGLWSMDLVRECTDWDPRFKKLMGLDPDQEIDGVSAYDLIHPGDVARVRAAVQSALIGHAPFEAEFRVPLKEGNPRWILARGKGFYDPKNRPVRLLGVAFDITQRKANEKRSRENQAQIELQHRLMSQRESERRKIAQDLHDGPLQELIALTFEISSEIAQAEDPALVEQLEQTREGLKRQIGELRLFASELRPPALDKFGLDKAIDSHLEKFRKKYPEIDMRLEPQSKNIILPETSGLALYRIYQESLNNIVRHSQASRVRVRVGTQDHMAELEVNDNGCGFQVPEEWLDLARQGHLGLVGIHERAEAIGGSAWIYSRPGEGTIIRVRVPLATDLPAS